MPNDPILYPLTASQGVMYYSQKYSKTKSIINICSMLHFDAEIDVNIMLQAISLGLHRNRSASIRMRKDGKGVKQYFSEQPPEAVIVLDYSDKTDAELDEDIAKWSSREFPNGSFDVQLYTCKLIKKPNSFYALYFCVSHLAFDAYSIIMTATDILGLYDKLLNAQPITPSKSDPLPSYHTEWEYFKSHTFQADKDFWRNEIFATEPYFTSVNGSKITPCVKGKRYGKTVDPIKTASRHENFTLGKETVDKVNELAKELRISPQCIYLLAARSYLSKVNDDADDVTIANNIARRATLVEKRAGGTRVQSLLFRMNFSNSLTVRDALIEINALQKKYYTHADLPSYEALGIFREVFGVPAMYGYNTLYLTYQPYFVAANNSLPVHLTIHSSGSCNMPLYLTVMALDNSGNLNFNFDYPVKVTRKEVPGAMFEHMVKVFEAITKGTQMSVLELNRL